MKFCKTFKKEAIVLGSSLLIAGIILFGPFFSNSSQAQTGLFSKFIPQTPLAIYIGGYTEGPGKSKCCNGTALSFKSIDPKIPVIINGEALFVPGVSRKLSYGNEAKPGFCTLGLTVPGVCMTAASECEVAKPMPQIVYVGTSLAPCIKNQVTPSTALP